MVNTTVINPTSVWSIPSSSSSSSSILLFSQNNDTTTTTTTTRNGSRMMMRDDDDILPPIPKIFCNAGDALISRLEQYLQTGKQNKYQFYYMCDMWTSEQPYSEYATRGVYTIIREPLSHIVSQYSHCKESQDHIRNQIQRQKLHHYQNNNNKNKSTPSTSTSTHDNNSTGSHDIDLMPSLDAWLEAYRISMDDTIESNGLLHNIFIQDTYDDDNEDDDDDEDDLNTNPTTNPNPNRTLNITYINTVIKPYQEKLLEQSETKYDCYNPINSQSEYTRFPPMNVVIPSNYTYPYYPYKSGDSGRSSGGAGNDNDNNLDTILFRDLQQKYNIIGDLSRITKSVCTTFCIFLS